MVRDGPPLLKAKALAALATLFPASEASVASLGEALSANAYPAVRAAALRLLAGLAPTPGRLARFANGLADPDRRVRREAADALAAHGDQAIGLLRDMPSDLPDDVWEATVWALGRMQSRPAQKMLRVLLAPTLERAAENAALLRQLPGARDPRLWRPLELALADSNARLVERVLKVLSVLPRGRVIAQLRRALASTDLRTRANAVEALASLPDRGLIAAALPLVEAVSCGPEVAHGPISSQDPDELVMAVLRRAERSWDLWLRRGAAAVRGALAGGPGEDVAAGDAMEVDMELLVFLKRTPLFGPLPLDTLLALSRVLVPESYLAGETVFSDGSPGHCLYLVRSGAVAVLKDERLLARLGPETYVGEMALIDDAPRSASLVAAEDCTLLRLDRATFHDLTEDYPAMLHELCKLLAANLREANRRLADPLAAASR
jgi:HEAT repeat protein